jgi:hypothetical protein
MLGHELQSREVNFGSRIAGAKIRAERPASALRRPSARSIVPRLKHGRSAWRATVGQELHAAARTWAKCISTCAVFE